MIFVNAQPDDFYFIWQIEIQLFNLNEKQWPIQNIHILIGYNPLEGVSAYTKKLISDFPQCNIFVYPDTRTYKTYASTIRPHIIEKHLIKFSYLREAAIFYIDSDVIFRELPNFNNLLKNDNWYASDTGSYMGYDSIINSLGEDVFNEMCGIVNISPQVVLSNKKHIGGAQYIIKNIPEWFWPKVEEDSIRLYQYLYNKLYENTSHNFFQKDKFDIWLTEMWVVCWNAILAGKPFTVSKEMSFCWASQTKNEWENTCMLHYAGSNTKNMFRKTDYAFYPPFYADLSHVSPESSTAPLVELIQRYRTVLNKNRIDLSDTLFLFHEGAYTEGKRSKLKSCIRYLQKNFETNICLVNSGDKELTCESDLEKEPKYFFVNEKDFCLENILLEINARFICSFSETMIIPVKQILRYIDLLRNGGFSKIIFDKNSSLLKLDIITEFIFSRQLEDDLLLENKNKLKPILITDATHRFPSFFIKEFLESQITKEKTYESLSLVVKKENGIFFNL